MTIIIVGADEVGSHLIELEVRDGIDLVVVEETSSGPILSVPSATVPSSTTPRH